MSRFIIILVHNIERIFVPVSDIVQMIKFLIVCIKSWIVRSDSLEELFFIICYNAYIEVYA